MLFILSGCGKQTSDEAKLHISKYAIKQYETVTANKADVTPKVECQLKVSDFQVVSYRANADELAVDKVYVTLGDTAKKGQVLVSFQSDELDDQKREVTGQISEAQETLNHLQKVYQIDQTKENKTAIADQQTELSILRTKLSEIEAKLASYSIVAKETGTITKMHESLKAGVVNSEDTLIEQTCGSDDYVTTSEDVKFKVGETYKASIGVVEYEMKVVKVDEDGTVHFKPQGDMKDVSVADDLDLVIEKEPLKQVIAIPSVAVNSKTGAVENDSTDEGDSDSAGMTNGEIYYVRVINEAGYPTVREVKISKQVVVDNQKMSIIDSGLTGGERVVMP